eukprot:5175196-Pyramimonas_sp.AAC.1
MVPRRPKTRARSPKRAPKAFPQGPREGKIIDLPSLGFSAFLAVLQDSPRGFQNRPQEAPRPPQDHPKKAQEAP